MIIKVTHFLRAERYPLKMQRFDIKVSVEKLKTFKN